MSRVAALRGSVAAALALAGPVLAGDDAQAPAQAPADDITPVEKLLFATNQLTALTGPTRLEYRYTKEGEGAFTDRVVLTITGTPPRHVAPDFLSDGHRVPFPEVDEAHGNPLLLYFLEADLRDMQRATGGQSDYFRRLIRRAMAVPGLKIEDTEATVDGHPVAARRIVIAPFRSDPKAPSRYPSLVGKTYEFVYSTAVPGQIVSLATHVPATDGKAESVRVDWLGSSPL